MNGPGPFIYHVIATGFGFNVRRVDGNGNPTPCATEWHVEQALDDLFTEQRGSGVELFSIEGEEKKFRSEERLEAGRYLVVACPMTFDRHGHLDSMTIESIEKGTLEADDDR